MQGQFKKFLVGICQMIQELYILKNDCFTKNREAGVYYFLKGILHIAKLHPTTFDIEPTKCTMSPEEEAKVDCMI